MPRTVTVRQIELKGSEHVRLHKFPLPGYTDPGFYRTMISYSAFFESTKRRNQSPQHLFLVCDEFATERRGDYEIERDAALPVTEHASLVAFLTGIGYDRSTKRFRK